MASKAVVLDANILIRAVLGQHVRRILESYAESVCSFPKLRTWKTWACRPKPNHRSLTGL
jgi:hypothetical protein